MSSDAPTRTALAVSSVGWAGLALLDLWAGIDVLIGSSGEGDTSPIVDSLGNDSVVSATHIRQPELLALVAGLLVLLSIAGLWIARRDTARRLLHSGLIVLALASVLVLASGGHAYALLVPVCLLVGAGSLLVRAGRPKPRGSTAPRRRPSPVPRATV
jgi:hypothetical protein